MIVETSPIIYTVSMTEEEMRLFKSYVANSSSSLEREFKVNIQELFNTLPGPFFQDLNVINVRTNI